MKKILVFFLICISVFFSSCTFNKNEKNIKQKNQNSNITLYTDESLEAMTKDICNDFNLNGNNKLNFKIISKTEMEKLIKKSDDNQEKHNESSKSLKKQDIKIFIGYDIKNENYKSENIGKDGIGVIANKDFPLDNINIEKIRDIYSGKIKTLKEMEGIKNKNEDKINFITLQQGSVLRDKFDEKVMISPSKINYDVHCIVSNSIEELIQKISYKNSIAYCNMQNVKANTKVLKLNGINFSHSSIETGIYPLTYDIKIMYKKEDKKNIEEFVNYLKSDEGKKIIQNYCIVSK